MQKATFGSLFFSAGCEQGFQVLRNIGSRLAVTNEQSQPALRIMDIGTGGMIHRVLAFRIAGDLLVEDLVFLGCGGSRRRNHTRPSACKGDEHGNGKGGVKTHLGVHACDDRECDGLGDQGQGDHGSGQQVAARPSMGLLTQPISCIGLPVVAVPVWSPGHHLPLGVQVITAPWREDLALRVAAELETRGVTNARLAPQEPLFS